MLKPLSTLIVSMVVCQGAAMAQDAGKTPGTAAWQQQLQSATWPHDIARLADRGLQQSPDSATARELVALRDKAEASGRVLQAGRVQLARGAFAPDSVPSELRGDLR